MVFHKCRYNATNEKVTKRKVTVKMIQTKMPQAKYTNVQIDENTTATIKQMNLCGISPEGRLISILYPYTDSILISW